MIMKGVNILLLLVTISFHCYSRDIIFNFCDPEGFAINHITIKVTTSTLNGTWKQFNGIMRKSHTIAANSRFVFHIDEKTYFLTFTFEKEGFFTEKWELPVYSTDKRKNVEKTITFSPKIKKDNISVKMIILTLDIFNNKKNIISIKDIFCKQKSNIIPAERLSSLHLDVFRDTRGNPINAPISKFNSHRFWPKSILVKLDNASVGQGFFPVKNSTVKQMQFAPKKGYSSILEVDPRKFELNFYFFIDGYFGKGIVHDLNQRRDKQWEMKIVFIVNIQRGNNNLQCDFDYDAFHE